MAAWVTRRGALKAGGAFGLASLSPSAASNALAQQNRPIKVGFVSIFSGRVAQLGVSSKNALQLKFDAFNRAGGLNGQSIELIARDSKGRPEEAARIVRELIESDGCDIILDGEASSAAFAVHEVARSANVLCLHVISETTELTADPKFRSWNTFRTSRQALHDSIVGGSFAARVAKDHGLKRWATIAADYAYGRQATPEFIDYVRAGYPDIELVAESWPKLFQPDYTENITKILQAKPQALFCGLWGGDLVSFIDQGNLFGLFEQVDVFAIHLADYTTLAAVKLLPKAGIYSSNRYLSLFPARPENAAWADAYAKRFNARPTNWSWEADLGAQFLIDALIATGGAEPRELAAAIKGREAVSPVGMRDNKVAMRAEDQTIVDYALGWGRVVPQEPFLVDLQAADWAEVFRAETAWKKSRGFL